jgi:orotidine-5'-phosphate decarboxylase
LGVTVLTSLRAADLRQVGIQGSLPARAVSLARLAKRAGLDGAVASAQEVPAIRYACGPGFIILVPAVRPAWARADDQVRVATPAEAIRAGADYLVVGRPITGAKDPRAAAERILEEIAAAQRSRV